MTVATTRYARFSLAPNPLWIRELRQASRVQRTPFILMTLTVLAALGMGAISGMASRAEPSSSIGATLFQAFFSMAFFVVALVGAAVGANNIASEREGKTWEPLVLTGLPAHVIARGKFLAGLTSVSLYVAILAPVGALPFLFGGIGALEVVIAFLGLILVSSLSVGFGLTVGSAIQSGRVAIVVAIVAAAFIALAGYQFLGSHLGILMHQMWEHVDPRPIWYPAALVHAPFTREYVIILIVQPGIAFLAIAWLFYAVTVSNMTSAFKDRSRSLVRWFTVMSPLCAAALASPALIAPSYQVGNIAWRSTFIFSCLVLVATVLFQDDSSPRHGIPRLRPLLRAIAVGIPCLSLLTLALMLIATRRAHPDIADRMKVIVYLSGGYLDAFSLFTMGLAAWLRTLPITLKAARLTLIAVLVIVVTAPFVAAAVMGMAGGETMLYAVPSPAYTMYLAQELSTAAYDVESMMHVWIGAWGMLGVGLLALAIVRARRSV